MEIFMVTLLRVPDVVKAINPMLQEPISIETIFQLIGEQKLYPFGYVCRAPIFVPEQVTEIARIVQREMNSYKCKKGDQRP